MIQVTTVGAVVIALSLGAANDDERNKESAQQQSEGARPQGEGEMESDQDMMNKPKDAAKDASKAPKDALKGTSLGARIDGWPTEARDAVNATIAQYGEPDVVTDKKLIWESAGSFKEIFVMREPLEHNFPMPHKDVLGAVIDYKVPPEKFDDIALFDGSVIADRTRGTLTAKCDKMEMNFVALNLADEIVRGKKSVQQARDALHQAAMQVKSGNAPSIAQRLQFNVVKTATADPDKPAMRAIGQ